MDGIRSRYLLALVAVRDRGSINAASEVLHLTQPAISRAIRIIEAHLGVPLFNRHWDGVTLTEFGECFIERAVRALNYLTQADRAMASFRPSLRRHALHSTLSHRHLASLVAIADSESMSFAAHQLGVSQTAMYKSLREVETIVGARLFERRDRRMALTPCGEIMVRHSKLFFAELRHGRDEVAALSGAVSDHVVIGVLPLSRTKLVPSAITQLARVHPDMRFSLIDGPYSTLLSGLRCGDLDMIIGAMRLPSPAEDVVQKLLFHNALSIVARAGHPLARKRRITMANLAAARWVLPSRATPTRAHFEALFAHAGLPVPRATVECSSLVAIRALLEDNDWLTILSCSQIQFEEKLGVLTVLPIALSGTERPIGITFRADARLSPGAQRLIEKLEELSGDIRYGRSTAA